MLIYLALMLISGFVGNLGSQEALASRATWKHNC